jgi:choloylglycine hydrolase
MKRAENAIRIILILSILIGGLAQPGFTCSTFVLQDEENLVFGRNFDFYTSKGMVVINKKNVAKTAMLIPPENPVSWVSKYGSITFNQIGKEFAFGGMNEEGLVVEMMSLMETGCPPPDERPAMMELQWIQYQLDNYSTVDEVIRSHDKVRIAIGQMAPIQHYLICDLSGKAATIEFIDGELVYHTGESLPVSVLTNNTYEECLAFHNSYDSLAFEEKIARTSLDSRDRFAKIARRIQRYRSENINPPIEFAFDILGSVSAGKYNHHATVWSIVYDIKNFRIYFKTYENRNIRTIGFDDFDFSCSSPDLVLDLTANLIGDVSDDFVEYSTAMNMELVNSVMTIYNEAGFMEKPPEAAIQFLAGYPEMVKCMQEPESKP